MDTDLNEYVTSTLEEYFERRAELLKDTDYKIVRKAWFSLSHLLLNEHAKVADMGCDDGSMTYAMAVLAPNIRFTGVDKSKRQINKAKEMYGDKVHNLDFIHADVGTSMFEPESLDAIVNSYILHEVYSGSRYNEKIVSDTLAKQFKMLKSGGTMFIRDFARPPPEEYVLMEMPDISVDTEDLTKMSETDLLVWYSENARPRQDAGCGGFWLEELPARFPKTRLFRVPYKWAYEFLMRKDDREKWDKQLPMEYTFFTQREFRKELRGLGARVEYSTPYWDDDYIEDHFEGRFRMYDHEGKALGFPPTCYLAVARKMKDRQSLLIGERRPAKSDTSAIRITAMRNEVTGEITDVISRDFTPAEVIPYTVNEEGRLKIYLHDGIPRGVVNTVPRNGDNIDGKRWSGHMIEALTVDSNVVNEIKPDDIKDTVRFARDYVGLKPRNNALLYHGPDYYPAPDHIDERIKTYFLDVERNKKAVKPKNIINKTEKFTSKGDVREFDAQQVLNAITVGLIPNARLELQILSLFEHLNLKPETWTSKDLNIQKQKINKRAEIKDLLHQIHEKDERFKAVKGSAGQLRTVHSIFVEEGQTQGSTTGLSADDMDFVVSDEKTINTAVVIPLTKGINDDLQAGLQVDYFPVPQRHESNGLTMHAPSFNIPAEITNIKQLKKFIAEKFSMKPENVVKMGESYFTHIGLTQHRVYPFAIVAPPEAFGPTKSEFLPFHQYRLLWSSLSKETHFMVVIARAWQAFNDDIKKDFKLRVKEIVQERFAGKNSDWGIPMSYAPPPGKMPDKQMVRNLSMEKDAPPKIEITKTKPVAQTIIKEPPKDLEKDVAPKEEVKVEQPHEEKPKQEKKVLKKLSSNHTPFHQRSIEANKKEPEAEPELDFDSPVHKAAEERLAHEANEKAALEAQEQVQKEPEIKKPKVETDTQLSDEFAELEELANVVQETMPERNLDDLKPEKW